MKLTVRERNLSANSSIRKSNQGESLELLWSYRCYRNHCNARKSPRANSFFASMDRLNRANVKISYRQVLEIYGHFPWTDPNRTHDKAVNLSAQQSAIGSISQERSSSTTSKQDPKWVAMGLLSKSMRCCRSAKEKPTEEDPELVMNGLHNRMKGLKGMGLEKAEMRDGVEE